MPIYRLVRTVTFVLDVSADDADSAAELAGDVEISQWDEIAAEMSTTEVA